MRIQLRYSGSERAKIREIINTFGDYIKAAKNFDIIHSRKFGYIKISFADASLDSSGTVQLILDSEDMLELLFFEILADTQGTSIDGEYLLQPVDEGRERFIRAVHKALPETLNFEEREKYLVSAERFLMGISGERCNY